MGEERGTGCADTLDGGCGLKYGCEERDASDPTTVAVTGKDNKQPLFPPSLRVKADTRNPAVKTGIFRQSSRHESRAHQIGPIGQSAFSIRSVSHTYSVAREKLNREVDMN